MVGDYKLTVGGKVAIILYERKKVKYYGVFGYKEIFRSDETKGTELELSNAELVVEKCLKRN